MKRLAILLTLGLFALALGTAQSYDPTKKYEVTIGAYGDLEKAYKQVFDSADFKAKFPNLSFKFQTADFNGHHTRLTTVLAAGEQTNDIEALEIGYIAQFVAAGGLTDLNAAPFKAKASTKDIVKFSLANATTNEGALVAMPVDIAPAVMFYRSDLAKKVGVDMENLKDWDAYIAALKKMSDPANKVYGIEHPAALSVIPLNGGKGGWFKDNKPLEPKAKFLGALNLVQKVKEARVDGDLSAWTGPWSQAYIDGKVTTAVNGAWFGGTLRTWLSPEAGKWRVAYLPGKTMASLGGTYLSIPMTVPAPRKAAAWEVIKYLATNPGAQLITFKAIDAFPALTSVYNDKVMDEPVDYYGGQKVRKIFADVALHIPENKVSEYDAVILSIWNSAVLSIMSGKATPEAAYGEMVKKVVSTIQ